MLLSDVVVFSVADFVVFSQAQNPEGSGCDAAQVV